MRRTLVASFIIQFFGCASLLSEEPPAPSNAPRGAAFKESGSLANWRDPTPECRYSKHAHVYENQELLVTDVKDGDTVHGCLMPEGREKIKIRLKGIDCPESRYNAKCEREGRQGGMTCEEQVPLGQKAKRRAETLMYNKTIKLESTKGRSYFEKDHYGRILSYIRLNNNDDFALEMIKGGYCKAHSFGHRHPRKERYERAGRENK